jgi:type VI secretion system protein ImpD
LRLAIDRQIAEIDEIIAAQVDAVIQHPRFQKLEASWRGLLHLVRTAETVGDVRIRLLQVRWQELCHDFERSAAFDSSTLFQKVYEQEFGMAGGEPFGLLLGDFEIAQEPSRSHRTDDIKALGTLAAIAAAAFAPFVANASPTLFGVDSFQDLVPTVGQTSPGGDRAIGVTQPAYFREMMQDVAYGRWRTLRSRADAMFLALTLPHCLIREPEDELTARAPFRGRLTREAATRGDFLFAPAVYAFGSIVISAFARSGWFADMRGARREDGGSGGLVPGLPSPPFPTDAPDVAQRAPLETEIDFVQERVLDELGFIPLVRATGTPQAMIRSTASLQRVVRGSSAAEQKNSALSAMLQYILCVSRFAHYLKVFGRELVGARVTAAECEQALGSWIREYTTPDENARPEMLARRPLRESRVEVRENPAVSGGFLCRAWLKPHFLLDRLLPAFELTTELGRPSDVVMETL